MFQEPLGITGGEKYQIDAVDRVINRQKLLDGARRHRAASASDNPPLVEIVGKAIDLSLRQRVRLSYACRGRHVCRPSERADIGARTFLSAVNRGLENPRSLIRAYHDLTPSSSHNPIRPRQHIRGNRHADLVSGFEIDEKLELRRLLDWNVGGLGAFQDLGDKVSGAPE